MLNSKEMISFMSFLFFTSWGKLSFRFALCLTTKKNKKNKNKFKNIKILSTEQSTAGPGMSAVWTVDSGCLTGQQSTEICSWLCQGTRRAGLSKANDSDKALKAPLILNYLAISDESGCGILIFCWWESADIFGSFPPFSLLVSMYLIEGNISAFQSIPTPLKTPPSVSWDHSLLYGYS